MVSLQIRLRMSVHVKLTLPLDVVVRLLGNRRGRVVSRRFNVPSSLRLSIDRPPAEAHCAIGLGLFSFFSPNIRRSMCEGLAQGPYMAARV